MPGFGLGITLAQRSDRGTPLGCRIVPGGPNEAFVVAPHPTIGAIALHLLRGNGIDAATPAASVGAPFGDWRIQGFRRLASVTSDPAAPAEVLYQGTGSQEYAVLVNDAVPANQQFAGIYHGLGSGGAMAQRAPDLALSGAVGGVTLAHEATLAWPGGRTGTATQSVTLGADGAIVTRCVLNVAHDTLSAFPAMTILGDGFTRLSVDGGTYADLPAGGDTAVPVGTAAITLRNPVSGTIVTIADTGAQNANLSARYIRRGNAASKYYVQFDTPAQAPLGIVDITRTITFGTTPPDAAPAFAWDGATNGNSGYNRPFAPSDNATWDAGAKQIVLTRGANASYTTRVTFALAGLTVGQAYSVTVTLIVSGGSPSAGTTVGVSAQSNGASATALGNAANGSPSYAFTATAATMYLSLHQVGAAGSDNVLRIGRVTNAV